MKKTVNVLNLIALIVLFAGCTLRPVDNTTLGVEIPGETLENLLTPFMYSYPQDGSEYKPYFKLTWEYQGNGGEETIPVSEITGCQDFLMGNKTSIPDSQKIFTINDIPVGSNLTANLELFDAYGFALYSSKTVRENITAKDKSLTLDLYSTSPVVYYDFSSSKFYGVADDDETQTFTLSGEGLECSYLQPRSFPYIREKIEENQPRAHCGTMIATDASLGAVIPPGRIYTSSANGDFIHLDASSQTPQWVAGGTDFTKNKIWAVREGISGDQTKRILCYGGKYYEINLDSEISAEGPLFEAYNYGSSINWAVDDSNLYAVIRDGQGISHYFLRGPIQEEENTVTLSDTGFVFEEPGVPSLWGDNTSTNGITDATARDGALYFLYCQRRDDQTETRGFLYKIHNAANMPAKSTTDVLSGWTDDDNHIPGDSGPMGNKLYNPLRFVAVKPEKLYIADGGFRFNKAYNESDDLRGSDMNRIVVFDLQSENLIYDEAMSLENVSLVGTGTFSMYYPTY